MHDVDDLIDAWTLNCLKQEPADQLIGALVPCSSVREIIDIVNDRHMHERGALEWIDHPQFGRIVVQRSSMRYGGAPATQLRPSGQPGQHNAEVFGEWLGLEEDELTKLSEQMVI